MRVLPFPFPGKRGISVFLVAASLTGAGGGGSRAEIPVALELVLAVDVSASVDVREFDLQMMGLAAALRDPAVVEAIRGGGADGIAVALVQWAGPLSQDVSVEWTHLRDAPSTARFADRIEAAPRLYLVEETAIAHVLNFAIDALDDSGFAGRRRVIDVSGDGPNNYGRPADALRDWAAADGITVNGLAILSEHVDVAAHYREHLIGGDGAFLVKASGYDDFARAMRLKLLREIKGQPLARAAAESPPNTFRN